MPYLHIETNVEINSNKAQAMLNSASQTVATALKKPEKYVMVSLKQQATMLFSGTSAPLAYLELKSLGLEETTTAALSAQLCTLMQTQLGVDPGRIYIEFAAPERPMWGWNSATF
ncbi:MAG: hypothetical protein GXP10_08235 [Gammaproteobacteria bacterium]|nr:hypothetical protein [Gammaproteobacteria bacterium]